MAASCTFYVQISEELLSRRIELVIVLEGKVRASESQNETDFNATEGSGSIMECTSLQSRNLGEGDVV